MASHHLNLKVDPALYRGLLDYAKKMRLTRSAAIRDLLRRQLGVVRGERALGWEEGYFAAQREIQERVAGAIHDLATGVPRR